MTNAIQSIALDKLVPHPDNPNRMSKANFTKLVRNIKRTGRYEPLIVRPSPRRSCHSCGSRNPDAGEQTSLVPSPVPSAAEGAAEGCDCFEIINGHHRAEALAQLGYKTADAIVWDIDDEQADILLATLNRLGGSDILDKKLALLKRLNARMQTNDLAKLLPHTAKQIERLTNLADSLRRASSIRHPAANFANPLVFFLDDEQSAIVEDALFLAQLDLPQVPSGAWSVQENSTLNAVRCTLNAPSKAGKKAAALTEIARFFLATSRSTTR